VGNGLFRLISTLDNCGSAFVADSLSAFSSAWSAEKNEFRFIPPE
jgi:hypothetical protein